MTAKILDMVQKRLVKQYVTIYLTQGEFFAGMFITESWPENWRDDLDAWHAEIKAEFGRRGYNLVYPEDKEGGGFAA